MSVQLREYRPSEGLRPYVQMFWRGRFDPQDAGRLAQRVAPNGFLEVIVHLTDHHCDLPDPTGWGQSPDYMLIGLQSASYEVRFTREVEVFGIRFKPAGFYTLFGVPPGELANTYEDLVAVLGAPFRVFAARLRGERDGAQQLRIAEQYLYQAVGARELTYLNRATELIRSSGGGLRVADVADRLCISPRQLERAFKQALGLSPKQYMRIARLNLVQRLLLQGRFRSLADVAYQAGYADQAHFNREFKRLVGEQPSRFLAQRASYVAAGPA